MSNDGPESWTDQQLVEGIRGCDEAALRWLQQALDRMAKGWIQRQGVLPDRPEILAEQARDQAMDKILSRIDTFEYRSKLTSWMQTIFNRKLGEILRRFRGGALERPGGGWHPIESLEALLIEPRSEAVTTSPSAAVLALRACLERLSPSDQDVVRSILLDAPDEELAAQMEISPAALRQRRHRALLRLKACFLPRMPSFA